MLILFTTKQKVLPQQNCIYNKQLNFNNFQRLRHIYVTLYMGRSKGNSVLQIQCSSFLTNGMEHSDVRTLKCAYIMVF